MGRVHPPPPKTMDRDSTSCCCCVDFLVTLHDQSGESTNHQKQRWSCWVEPPIEQNDNEYIKIPNPMKHLFMSLIK